MKRLFGMMVVQLYFGPWDEGLICESTDWLIHLVLSVTLRLYNSVARLKRYKLVKIGGNIFPIPPVPSIHCS